MVLLAAPFPLLVEGMFLAHYVDDSHSCLKKNQVDAFHQHLNSINANIHFTLELEDANGYGLPFLDSVTSRRGTAIQVEVYRKLTHTDRYLD